MSKTLHPTAIEVAVDVDGLYVALQETITEHRDKRGPWRELVPPEQLVLEEIAGVERRLRFLTFGCALDYARDADVHWRSMELLWTHVGWAYDPRIVARIGPAVLEMSFSQAGVRFWSVDAETWWTIAESIVEAHDGLVINLCRHCEYDAVKLLEHVQSDATEPYPYLGGAKIAPMWLRMIDEYVFQLDRIGAVALPIDVQIEKVTTALAPEAFGDESEAERRNAIRTFWTDLSDAHGLPLYRVDEVLWQLGRHWDDWGQEYFATKLADAGVESPLTEVPVATNDE